MALDYISDHEGEALDRLPHQFKEKPNIEAFIRAFIGEIQSIEDAVEQILKFRWVDTAVGYQLDGLGKIVGESRNGRNDDAYRLAIKLRIAINTCEGTPEEVIAIFLLVTLCTQCHYFPIFPAAVDLYGDKDFSFNLIDAGPDAFAFDGGPDGLGFGDVFDSSVGGKFAAAELVDLDYIFNLIQSILPAGVLLDHIGFYDGADAFAFEGYADGKGFGDVFDPTVGGKFASILV